MEGKPNHYDGSVHADLNSTSDQSMQEPQTLTSDIRKNISGNPYLLHKEE